MSNSQIFMPVISQIGVVDEISKLSVDSNIDNVLLEYRMAIELHRREMISEICPVFVGEKTDCTASSAFLPLSYSKFVFQSSSQEEEGVVVKTVEDGEIQYMHLRTCVSS